jgi:hypothetical protein
LRVHTPIEGLVAIIDDLLSLKVTGRTALVRGLMQVTVVATRSVGRAVLLWRRRLRTKSQQIRRAELRLSAGQGTHAAYAGDPLVCGMVTQIDINWEAQSLNHQIETVTINGHESPFVKWKIKALSRHPNDKP